MLIKQIHLLVQTVEQFFQAVSSSLSPIISTFRPLLNYPAAVIWGLVGPARLYSSGKIYSGLLHFFWIGALMPILTYFAWKYTKKDWLRKVNWPLIFVGTYNVPPATGINYSSWAVVNLLFNHWIKNKVSLTSSHQIFHC